MLSSVSNLHCQPRKEQREGVARVSGQKRKVLQFYLVKPDRVLPPVHDVLVKMVMEDVITVRNSYAAYAAPS